MDEYGGQAAYLTAFSLIEPTPYGELAAAGAWIAQYAARNNCDWDPDKPGPAGEHIVRGCQKVSPGGKMSIRLDYGTGSGNKFETNALEILSVEEFTDSYDDLWYRLRYVNERGTQEREDRARDGAAFYETQVTSGSCVTPDPGPTPTPPPVYNYTDTETGCTMNVAFKGWAVGAADRTDPVFEIESTSELRADGGRVGGCNFQPIIYADTGGPGGPTIPVPPNPPGPGPLGEPWWVPFVRGAAQGVGALAAQALLNELFKAKIAPANFSFVAPCDKKEDGTPAEVIYQFDEQNYQSRVLSQQAVLMEMLQQHLNWKTPICYGNDQGGAYWRSITFESTTYSDNSNSRLVKRFRYRSNSPGDVGLLAQHWAGFSWNTGPVIVKHTGSALGSPQVWASSVDEGKRVIQHAGGEAGIDPNQTGEWSISSSNSPRYGVQRTVVLKQVDGCWMATSRQGPEGWPEAASVTPALGVPTGQVIPKGQTLDVLT